VKLDKAYENRDFLHSREARAIRIQCEQLEPEQRFRTLGVNRAVIVFGSARLSQDSVSCRDAADLAERVARWTVAEHALPERYHLCTGGGPGIMQAVHEGAARVDRSLNIGLNISLPHEEVPNPFLDPGRAVEFHYFFMRKFWFMRLSRAMVIFPGGFGTLDELFEALTLTQTGKSERMPIVLYDSSFWNEIVNFEALARRGLIKPADLELFAFADTPEQAFELLRNGLRHYDGPLSLDGT
jgi:uncharacterized protein (TIGR00730 family)